MDDNQPGDQRTTPLNSTDQPAIPSDRDETAAPPREDAQHRANRSSIRQAHADVESGIQDTERIGTPNDVPSSDRNADRKP